MPDYKQGKIYTVRCKTDDTLIYIGCTTQSLCERMGKHKYTSTKRPNICFYQYVDDWDNWYIELFENFPCNSKEELNKREGEIIRKIGTVNQQIAGRTHKEWYDDNKEQVLNRQKENYNNNKDKILQKQKEYAIKNKDKIKDYKKEYANKNKQKLAEEKKKYQEKNRETLKEYLKQYYETNKKRIAEQKKKNIKKLNKHNK